jgi:hypothetical protein
MYYRPPAHFNQVHLIPPARGCAIARQLFQMYHMTLAIARYFNQMSLPKSLCAVARSSNLPVLGTHVRLSVPPLKFDYCQTNHWTALLRPMSVQGWTWMSTTRLPRGCIRCKISPARMKLFKRSPSEWICTLGYVFPNCKFRVLLMTLVELASSCTSLNNLASLDEAILVAHSWHPDTGIKVSR